MIAAVGTFGDVLREQRRSDPTHTAVVCGSQRFTYGELDERVNRVAAGLRARGVSAGERVLWLGQNCHRFLELLGAAAKLGAICCPANWRLSGDELAFVVDDCRPRVVIWQDAEIGDRVRAARAACTGDAEWLQHDADGPSGYESLLAEGPSSDPDVAVDAASALLMLYTAAFDGRPNGALLSHTAVAWQALVWGALHTFTPDTVYLASEPLFHVAGLMNLASVVLYGGTNVFTRRVDAEELCRLVATERCTTTYFIDKTIAEIVDVNRDRRYDLSSLRSPRRRPEWDAMVTVGTTPWDRTPGGYGQTETMGMLTYHALGGRPLPGVQVQVLDEDGNAVPDGEVGELVARGPTMMNGYWERPELNARRQSGGWHHTNDLGRRAPDASITWLGSMGRLIKSGSENVYPVEVEACLRRHPAVAECEVVGLPDAEWGETVKAIVVLRPGTRVTCDELIAHCRAHLASYKKPRHIEFVESLPS